MNKYLIVGQTIKWLKTRLSLEDIPKLTNKQLCYIVALGMGEVRTVHGWSGTPDFDVFTEDPDEWPDYISSRNHCMRVLEAIVPIVNTISLSQWDIGAYSHLVDAGDDKELIEVECADSLKRSVIEATGKCVIEGIELGVE